MDRRRFLLASLAGALAAPPAAEAQQAAKIARIDYLGSMVGNRPNHDAFLQGLRDLGYVEGRNVAVEYRGAEGEYERLPALAAELVGLKVDVVVAPATAFALAAKQATSTIPIVFVSLDAVTSGLVTNLGGRAAISRGCPAYSQIWSASVWNTSRRPFRESAGLLSSGNQVPTPNSRKRSCSRRQKARGGRLGVRLQFVEARSPADFDRAFSEMTKARVGALTVLPSALLIRERKRLVDLAAKHRLPAVYSVTEFVRDAGGLMVYGPNVPDLHRRAAVYVDKILKGAQPGDLPVEQPTKFELIINLKAARASRGRVPFSNFGSLREDPSAFLRWPPISWRVGWTSSSHRSPAWRTWPRRPRRRSPSSCSRSWNLEAAA